jgi:hypothetical protein
LRQTAVFTAKPHDRQNLVFFNSSPPLADARDERAYTPVLSRRGQGQPTNHTKKLEGGEIKCGVPDED